MVPPNLSTPMLLFFALTTAVGLLAFSPHGRGGGGDCKVDGGGGRVRESVSREFFPLEGDVAWVVQVSDLHLSAHHPERGDALRSQLASALRVVRPSLVLITGDITDAKNKARTSSRQDETEWMQYRDIIDAVVRESEIEKSRFIDIRGNHDKYGVPFVGHKLDFFSTYSISSQLNRLGTIQSISFVQTSALMGAYGVSPVALSPAFCWVPPLLLATAIYSTRSPTGRGWGQTL